MTSTSLEIICIVSNMVNTKKNSFETNLKRFPKVTDISDKEVSLITLKDDVKYTLNLAVYSHDRVLEMRINLKKIPVPDKTHLHKHSR